MGMKPVKIVTLDFSNKEDQASYDQEVVESLTLLGMASLPEDIYVDQAAKLLNLAEITVRLYIEAGVLDLRVLPRRGSSSGATVMGTTFRSVVSRRVGLKRANSKRPNIFGSEKSSKRKARPDHGSKLTVLVMRVQAGTAVLDSRFTISEEWLDEVHRALSRLT